MALVNAPRCCVVFPLPTAAGVSYIAFLSGRNVGGCAYTFIHPPISSLNPACNLCSRTAPFAKPKPSEDAHTPLSLLLSLSLSLSLSLLCLFLFFPAKPY
ncbi:hypothetical protein LY78DRAFT_652046, partial [Colletotrichum sublineola]